MANDSINFSAERERRKREKAATSVDQYDDRFWDEVSFLLSPPMRSPERIKQVEQFLARFPKFFPESKVADDPLEEFKRYAVRMVFANMLTALQQHNGEKEEQSVFDEQ